MGSYLSVLNNTNETVKISIYFAGSKTENWEKEILTGSSFTFKCPLAFSKTIIVNVNDKASRAVRINSKVVISKDYLDIIQLDLASSSINLNADSTELMKSKIREYSWNYSDKLTKVQVEQDYNNIMTVMNNITDNISYLVGGVAATAIDAKGLTKISANLITGALKGYLTNPLYKTKIKTTEESLRLYKIASFRHKLTSICRSKALDYELFKAGMNQEQRFEFLFNLFKQITQSDYLPFLEDCSIEEAIPLYILAISLILELLGEIESLKANNEIDYRGVSRSYLTLFLEHLSNMSEVLIETIELQTNKPTAKGFIWKTSKLTHQKNTIYILKGFSRGKILKRMVDIREAYVNNYCYQNLIYLGNPHQFIEQFQKELQE